MRGSNATEDLVTSTIDHIPWRRGFGEGLAIVASILLAFGIDAAWDDLQDRRTGVSQLAAYIGIPELHAPSTDRGDRP